MKRCSNKTCKKPLKEESEFGRNKNTKDGLNYSCKECCREVANTSYRKWIQSTGMEVRRRWGRSLKGRFSQLKRKARGHNCDLTFKQFCSLVEGTDCHYCGGQLPALSGHGLDRKDNSKGYEVGNVVPCCTRCNLTKGDRFTYREFVKFVVPGLIALDAERRNADCLKVA